MTATLTATGPDDHDQAVPAPDVPPRPQPRPDSYVRIVPVCDAGPTADVIVPSQGRIGRRITADTMARDSLARFIRAWISSGYSASGTRHLGYRHLVFVIHPLQREVCGGRIVWIRPEACGVILAMTSTNAPASSGKRQRLYPLASKPNVPTPREVRTTLLSRAVRPAVPLRKVFVQKAMTEESRPSVLSSFVTSGDQRGAIVKTCG